METIIAKITDDESKNQSIYDTAGKILKRGGLVAFPTETVYGLGADALDEKASAKIYAAKGRPSDNPLIVHIADKNDLYQLAAEVPESALKLSNSFWPGPLTMILKKKSIVPDTITGGLGTVAIRMPSHPVASRLIRESGVFIAAPSANTSGKPSPTRAKHVINDMNGKIDMIIADDTVDIGVESTIVDLSEGVPTILRPGYITKDMLSQVLGEVRIDPAIMGSVKAGVVPKAPGMKYKHYAPDASLAIVEGEQDAVIQRINELVKEKELLGYKVGIMTTEEMQNRYQSGIIKAVGTKDNEASVARNLFAALREFDQLGVQYIYSESFSTHDVGMAVMNRLIKAAGHTIIHA
jgi:L-threonylcarbamoyladenylate synthase